jgi:hypothetical protein
MLWNLVVLLKIWYEENKRTNWLFCFRTKMQGDLFILESWTKMTTWVEEIQLVAMEITRGKPSPV